MHRELSLACRSVGWVKRDDSKEKINRRDVLIGASTFAAAALGSSLPSAAKSGPTQPQRDETQVARAGPPGKPPYNIVFIIVDQQTHQLHGGPEYSLAGTDTIARNGVRFENHYIASAQCSPSRATFLTGRPPQYHHVIDQMQFDFVPTLNPSIPNVGSVLKGLGYKTAYFGKFEMDKGILTPEPTVNYSTAAQSYGFDVFSAAGDIGSAPLSGFDNDPFIAGESVRWLRNAAMKSRTKGEPFFMVAAFVNPHDIMYGDANVPGEPAVQKPVTPAATPPPPPNSIYEKEWPLTLPASLQESLNADGMPTALEEYRKGWDGWSGTIPTDRHDMWTIFYNYYLNTIQDNERNVKQIVDVFNEMDLWRDTVIVFTADHGEMGGSHGGLKGKGPFIYEQNAHVPLYIAHPTGANGAACAALTSHLDLVPTFVGLTGLPESQRPATVKAMPGRDFSSLLADPVRANLHAMRQGVLFNYMGLATVDAAYLQSVMDSQMLNTSPQPPLSGANLVKRGLLSFAFDGRYKFGRYYAPSAFNTPTTVEEILKNNDVQLFDLQSDPHELHNLALEAEKNRATILRMNQLLNDLIATEVGVNDGQFLKPLIEGKGELGPGG
ncbi:MAG TPA: sulfatase-like hydrolase/transferase [Candidatus Baltobacteraceae bacterium]|jgi:arylsulfatase|nr:sulfatase-like hydrolase/transferase [Candidatus Baltobacteraceae bacterium]